MQGDPRSGVEARLPGAGPNGGRQTAALYGIVAALSALLPFNINLQAGADQPPGAVIECEGRPPEPAQLDRPISHNNAMPSSDGVFHSPV